MHNSKFSVPKRMPDENNQKQSPYLGNVLRACSRNFRLYFVTLIFGDKMIQVTFTFCEQLPVPLSTTIIFISPLVYIPYTADIEMMIILLFCTANNLLHILT